MIINIIAWVVLGLIAGWIASIIMKTNESQGPMMDIILGVVGAVVGGYVMNLFGRPGATGFDLYSIIVAVIGAIILIWIGKLLRPAAKG